jgi:alpha-beta hydrolase superfamily lysophospholipase
MPDSRRDAVVAALPASLDWVFLHGLACEAGHWGDFLDRWRAMLPGAAVLALDLPGCGAERGCRSPTRVDRITDLVRASLPSQSEGRPRGPLALVGLSLGGMVALDWAMRYPAEVAAVATINTSVAGLAPVWRRLRPEAWWRLAGVALARTVEDRQRRIYGLISNRSDGLAAVGPLWTELARVRPVRRRDVRRQLLAAARFRPPRLPVMGARHLALTSSGDRMVHPVCSRRLVAATGGLLGVHQTAGHHLPLDDADWVLDMLFRWRQGAPDL